MLGLLRLLAFLIGCLTVIYVCLWFWLRAGARVRLEAEWDRKRPPLPRHTHVRIGLAAERDALRRRLIWGVYVIPVTVFLALAGWLNYA